MPIYHGLTQVNKKEIIHNSKQMSKVYVGDKLVWKEVPNNIITLGDKTYSSVQIGNLLWTNENMSYNDNLGGIYSPDNNIANVAEYGRLYTWNAALRIKSLLDNGWRIPVLADVISTYNTLGGIDIAGKKMKEAGNLHWTIGNTGTNDSGFNGRGAGILYQGSYYNFKNYMYLIIEHETFQYLYYSGALIYNQDKWDEGGGNPDTLTAWSLRLCKNLE